MTTQTTTIQPSTKGVRVLIGAAAASLALLGGALLWQARPASETASPVATSTMSAASEGVVPVGGLAEHYREQQQSAAAVVAARVTTTGGMAELYAERASVATPAPATTLGGLAEHYREQQTADRRSAALVERIGGMAELYLGQAQRAVGVQ